MKRLLSLFASIIIATSVFVSPVSAVEISQSGDVDVIYRACNDIDKSDGRALVKCLGYGTGGN